MRRLIVACKIHEQCMQKFAFIIKINENFLILFAEFYVFFMFSISFILKVSLSSHNHQQNIYLLQFITSFFIIYNLMCCKKFL